MRDTEDDHTPHEVFLAVEAYSAHLPLRPGGVVGFRRTQYPRSDVGYCLEDPPPIGADLFTPQEASARMCRRLIPVALVEAVDQGFDVMSIDRPLQATDQRLFRFGHRMHHLSFQLTRMKLSMPSAPNKVNPTRSYNSSGRRERARQLRDTTLQGARIRFLADGYVATTVESIAEDVGISAATIYKTYGGKAGLVRALCQQALEGAGPVSAEERSNALRRQTDPRRVIEGWGHLAAEVAPRVTPVLLLLRDAAYLDPESATLWAELDRNRLERMADNARYLADSGHLRPGVTRQDARDILWLYSSPELHDLLVNQRRWSVAEYNSFITRAMTDALL